MAAGQVPARTTRELPIWARLDLAVSRPSRLPLTLVVTFLAVVAVAGLAALATGDRDLLFQGYVLAAVVVAGELVTVRRAAHNRVVLEAVILYAVLMVPPLVASWTGDVGGLVAGVVAGGVLLLLVLGVALVSRERSDAADRRWTERYGRSRSSYLAELEGRTA